jgi:hypothetical protein
MYALSGIPEEEEDQIIELRNRDEQIAFEGRLVNLSKGQQPTVYHGTIKDENLKETRKVSDAKCVWLHSPVHPVK